MKIRTGFVSNSSSSSFLIYGVCLSHSEVDDALNEEDASVWDLAESLPKGFECNEPPDYESIYIGASWDTVRDDETGAQFKARVEKVLAEKFGKELTFGTFSEAWYNG